MDSLCWCARCMYESVCLSSEKSYCQWLSQCLVINQSIIAWSVCFLFKAHDHVQHEMKLGNIQC